MTYTDINKRFSDIVASYLSGGWVIDTSGVTAGYSGEKMRITLTDGKNIVCIRLVEDYGRWSDENCGKVSIVLGYADATKLKKVFVRPNSADSQTLWSEYLTVLHSDDFYTLNGYGRPKAFGSLIEARNAERIRRCRAIRNEYRFDGKRKDTETIDLTDTPRAKEAALKWVRAHAYKTYKLTDIEAVYKKVYHYDGETHSHYFVRARSKDFQMN